MPARAAATLPTAPRSRLRLRAAALYLGLTPGSLANRPFRKRLQIPAFKVGRALVFDQAELDLWLAKRREHHPAKGNGA